MKSTDLLNPGDFHQVTHQIRELVAYAISQLETAEQDGSLPSGKFAEFLEDAAKKCPGYHGSGTGLGKNQAIIEDGQTVVVDGFDVLLSVADSVFTGAQLKDPDSRIVRHGTACWNKLGSRQLAAKLEFIGSSINAVSEMPNVAVVVDGGEYPMHDQGGHAGRITAKVTANEVADMVFTTAEAHIIRNGAVLNCLNRTGADGKFEIAPDKSVGFRLSTKFGIYAAGDTAHTAALTLGDAAMVSTDNRIPVTLAANVAMSRTSESYRMRNTGGSRNIEGGKVIRTATGYTDYIRIPGNCTVLQTGDTFATDDNAVYLATIKDGRITKLTGVA